MSIAQKKKISLLCFNRLYPDHDGGSNTMIELCRHLARQGHDVSIFHFIPGGTAALNEEEAGPAIGGECPSHSVDRNCGVEFHREILPVAGHHGRIEIQDAAKRMSERLKRHPVDYVVTFDDCFPSLVTAYIAGIPGVHLFNSLRNIESFLRAAPPYRKMLSTRKVVVVSRFLQERVRKDLNVQSSICHPIIDLGRYVAQTKGTKGPAIGFYTDGSPLHKGDELVCRIVEKLPETHFVVVGKGFLHPWDGIPGNVEYRGLVSDMRTFYRDISMLLVPSFVEEGHSRVILEAAANGIPAIANHIGGIPEALGESGILVETGPGDNPDIERLTKRYVNEIRGLLRDGDTYVRLSEKAHRRALEYSEMQQGITLSSLLS